jgi:ribosomal-protein-alanine N-acetyltransferase
MGFGGKDGNIAGADLSPAARDRTARGKGDRGMIGSQIAAASVADAETLAVVHRACFAEVWTASTIARFLRESTTVSAVARCDPHVVGFALCRLAAEECEVLTCAVMPAFRRRGIGKLILEAAFAEAVRRGGRRAFLEVAADNDAARALYARCGLRPVGRRAGYYRRGDGVSVDALIMSCELCRG